MNEDAIEKMDVRKHFSESSGQCYLRIAFWSVKYGWKGISLYFEDDGFGQEEIRKGAEIWAQMTRGTKTPLSANEADVRKSELIKPDFIAKNVAK